MINIIMTATRRAEILEKTLKSFKENLFKDYPARLIINIDPVGPDTAETVVDIAVKYFEYTISYCPEEPSFSKAFKRIWEWPHSTEYAFHLEDDWKLLAPVDLIKLIDIMTDFPELAALRLPFKRQDLECMKNWKYYFSWNGFYFNCPSEVAREVGFCGHPSLIRGDFINAVAPFLDDTKNPEKQFHHGSPEIMEEIDKWDFGVYGSPNGPALIKDIGREWMIKNGYRKSGNKAFFTQWEKINA